MTAIDWPQIEGNPCYGVRRSREAPRDRYVESAELARFGRFAAPRWLRSYCMLKRVAGLRQGDMLRLGKPSDGDGWIRTVIGKVKKPAKIKRTWAVDIALRAIALDHAERNITSTLLFPTDAGTPLTDSGFKSAWRRAMAKHMAAGNKRFRENDIRAKGRERCRRFAEPAAPPCARERGHHAAPLPAPGGERSSR
jgi:integrase